MSSARPNPQYLVDQSGKKSSVVLTVKEYEGLIEDSHDLAVIAERGSEEPRVGLDDLEQRLKVDGVI